MTITTGHPDFQDYATWRGPTIAASTVNVTSGSPATFTGYVTNFASVFFGCALNSGSGVTITANWFTDATMTFRVAQKIFVLNSGNFVNQVMPNLGNFLQVVISTGQAGTQVVFVSVVPQNIPVGKLVGPRGTTSTGGVGTSVLNAAQPSFALTEVLDGDGILSVATSVTNANLGLFVDQQAEGGGTIYHLAETSGNVAEQQLYFKAISQPVVFTVHNFTGSTITVDWALMVTPG